MVKEGYFEDRDKFMFQFNTKRERKKRGETERVGEKLPVCPF